MSFTYDAVLLSSGDLFVTSTIADALNSSANTVYYTPTQKGYAAASVIVFRDEDGTADGGFFALTLNRTSLVTNIDYYESGAATVSNQGWTMKPANCVHNVY